MSLSIAKVAFLLRDAGEGGAERSSLRLANGLARRGVAVSLYFLRMRGPMLDSIDPGIKTVDLRDSFLRLIKKLREDRIDILLPVYTSMRALLVRFLLRLPVQVVLSQRNMFTMDRGPLQTRLRFWRCRRLFPYAAACVCISQGVAAEMKKLNLLPAPKIHVVYNPVVTDELPSQMAEPPTHPWLKEGQPPVLLGVGRLGDQKDFSVLVKAFALVAEQRRDVRLLILGEGKQRAALEKLVRDLGLTGRVSLPGYTANPYSCMSRAALFVSTSRFEGFGNVIAEALACGCNVVSTDCPSGPSEILEGGKYGWLAKVGDHRDVARAIAEALDAPLPSDALKIRAGFFSESRAVDGYLDIFAQISNDD